MTKTRLTVSLVSVHYTLQDRQTTYLMQLQTLLTTGIG